MSEPTRTQPGARHGRSGAGVPGWKAVPGVTAHRDGGPDLAAITRAASREAGGVPPGLLGDYLPAVLEAFGSGRRLSAAELAGYARSGEQAAEGGVALGGLVDLYLSATWRLWRELPAGSYSPMVLRAAVLAVLHAADDAVAAAAGGFERAIPVGRPPGGGGAPRVLRGPAVRPGRRGRPAGQGGAAGTSAGRPAPGDAGGLRGKRRQREPDRHPYRRRGRRGRGAVLLAGGEPARPAGGDRGIGRRRRGGRGGPCPGRCAGPPGGRPPRRCPRARPPGATALADRPRPVLSGAERCGALLRRGGGRAWT